jgi:hypothetical protein
MKIKLYQDIMFTRDVPEQQILAGDVTTVVDYVIHPKGGEEGAVLERFNAVSESIGILVLPISALTPCCTGQVLTAL